MTRVTRGDIHPTSHRATVYVIHWSSAQCRHPTCEASHRARRPEVKSFARLQPNRGSQQPASSMPVDQAATTNQQGHAWVSSFQRRSALLLEDGEEALGAEEDLAKEAEDSNPNNGRDIHASDRRNQLACRFQDRFCRYCSKAPRQLIQVILWKPGEDNAHEEGDRAESKERPED
jgi:hypothetical protein